MAKQNSRKRRMSQTELEERVYGTEPSFSDVEITDENRNYLMISALNYYNAIYDKKSHLKFVKTWLKQQEYFDIDSKVISAINPSYFGSTFFGLMRMDTNGWVLSESEIQKLKEHILYASKFVASSSEEDETNEIPVSVSTTTTRVSPQELIKKKVSEKILPELEAAIDRWLFAKTLKERKESINLDELIHSNEVKGSAAMNLIKEWISSKKSEYVGIKKTTDEDIIEGYSNLKPANINRVIHNLSEMLQKIDVIKVNAKNLQNERKPRKKKITPISKQLENVKYQKQDTTFNLTSILPEKLLDSSKQIAYLFDTKYRNLRILISETSAGFTLKGTTIYDFDEALSYSVKLRKPLEILPTVLTKTRKQIDAFLKSTLTTKPAKTTGRLNENTIILRVL